MFKKPGFLKQKNVEAEVDNQGYPEAFDEQWYRENYLAEYEDNIDPYEHYREEGWKQGFNPNTEFDTNGYVETYPEVLESGLDPLSHYEKVGKAKGFYQQGKSFRPSLTKYFFQEAHKIKNPKILEVGTKRSNVEKSTHSFNGFKGLQRSDYVMMDLEDGLDVDVVADIHALPEEWRNSFDIIIASAVFEHLERPWVAAKEMERVMKNGGLALVITHQTFPLHGYPNDYFRFSKDALRLIFEDAGFQVERAEYHGRTKIVPPEFILADKSQIDGWNRVFPSYAMVTAVARKP